VERLALHELIDPRLGESYDTYELSHLARQHSFVLGETLKCDQPRGRFAYKLPLDISFV